MGNEKNLIPFTKGDPRINRNGRPKNFDTLRHLAKELFKEISETHPDGTEITKIEAIFRDWMDSKNFHKQLAAVQYAYGKVPDKLDVTREGNRIIVEWEDTEIDAEAESLKLKGKKEDEEFIDDENAGFTSNPALGGGLEVPPSSEDDAEVD